MSPPILVVDDSEDAQEFFRGALADAGFDVLQARNGRDALALLVDQKAPRLVIVDLIMPVMDGAELVDVLHCYKRLAKIPVLMVSAADVPDALRMPGARYLKKPFDEEALLREVNGLLASALAL
jgi:CheY-like chemotaxis protein